MSNGVKSVDLAESPVLDEVLGNVTEGGVKRSRRQKVGNLSSQLLASGPLATSIDQLQQAALGGDALSQTVIDEVEAGRGTHDNLDARFESVEEDMADKVSSDVFAGHVGNTLNPHAVTKAQVGLGNADNTSDANKPISTEQAVALDAIYTGLVSHADNTSNPHEVTKEQLGLGDVDNTSDDDKPVSSAQQTALDLKAPISSPTFTGTVGGITKAMVGLGNVTNTSDADKPISTAQAAALDVLSNGLVSHANSTNNPHAVTKDQVGLGNVNNTSDADKPVSTAQFAMIESLAESTQPLNGNLTVLGGLDKASGNVILADGTTWTVKKDADLRTAIGLGTSDAPQFNGVNIGDVDTTLTRTSAGNLAIEGKAIYRAEGTDVPVTDGGTGASNAEAARHNLGLEIGVNVQAHDADLDALATLAKEDGNFLVGDGTAWTVESGSTARDSLGLGTGHTPQFTGINIGNANDTTLTRSGAGDVAVEGKHIYRADGTDVALTDGGTGASDAEHARENLGVKIGEDVLAFDPDLESLDGSLSKDNGANYPDIAVRHVTPAGDLIFDFNALRAVLTLLGLELGVNTGSEDILAIGDRSGRALLRFDRRGRMIAARSLLDQRLAVDARGKVYNLRRDGDAYLYESPVNLNRMLTYATNPYEKVRPAHVLATGPKMLVFIDYGQSWRGTWGAAPAGYANAALPELAFCLRNDKGALPSVYFPSSYGTIRDIHPIRPENTSDNTPRTGVADDAYTGGGAEIGRFAALAFQAFCLQDEALLQPVLVAGSPLSGSSWSEEYATTPGQFLEPGSAPWTEQGNILAAIPRVVAPYGLEPEFAAVGFTHGVGFTAGVGEYYDELTEMVAAYENLRLQTDGHALHFFTDQSSLGATDTLGRIAQMEQVQFCVDNAATVHLIGPRYPYAIIPTNNPHHTAEATCDIGVLEGYVKYHVLRKGLAWTPFRITSWLVAGNALTAALSNPFGTGNIAKDATSLPQAASDGFQVKVNGTLRTISSVTINGMTIDIAFSGAAVVSSDEVELQYAYDRPVGVANVAGRAGAWGNIKAVGPANPLWTGVTPKTVDTWLCIFKETKTIP